MPSQVSWIARDAEVVLLEVFRSPGPPTEAVRAVADAARENGLEF